MGAVAHLAPDCSRAVVAEVPFVDVVDTMLDDTLPLTVAEWDEWGDPRRPDDYAYMRSATRRTTTCRPAPARAAGHREPCTTPG